MATGILGSDAAYLGNIVLGSQVAATLLTHTTNSLIVTASSVLHITDCSLKKFDQAKTHTTNALLKAGGLSKSHSTNTLKQARLTSTHTTNCLLLGGFSAQHTTDTLKVSRSTSTHTTDCFLTGGLAVQHTIAALLKKTQIRFHATSALLQAGQLSNHATNALLKAGGKSRTHDTVSVLKGNITKEHSTNSTLKLVVQLEHSSDFRLIGTIAKSHTTNVLLKAATTAAHTTNTRVYAIRSLTHSSNTRLKLDSVSLTHTTTAWIVVAPPISGTASFSLPIVLEGVGFTIHSYQNDVLFPLLSFALHGTGIAGVFDASIFRKIRYQNHILLRNLYGWGSIDQALLDELAAPDNQIPPPIIEQDQSHTFHRGLRRPKTTQIPGIIAISPSITAHTSIESVPVIKAPEAIEVIKILPSVESNEPPVVRGPLNIPPRRRKRR